MAETESTITAVLGINIAGFQAGLTNASNSLKTFSNSVGANAGGVAKLAAGAAAAGAAIATALVKQSLEAVGAQVDLAKQLDTTYESLTNLKRAGELSGVSFGQIQQASKKLSIAMGEAAGGNVAMADAFARLNLNAAELSQMPLDQRIAAVNSAIKENIPATEQAAVAAQLFGSKAAFAIQALDADAIAEGANQARILGTALTDIQANQIEAAGDALSVFGEGLRGVGDQLTAQLSPYLQKAGDDFIAFAEQSGGMSALVSDGLQTVITATGFVVDAFTGIRRVGVMVFEGLTQTVLAFAEKTAAKFQGVMEIADKVAGAVGLDTGTEVSTIKAFRDEVDALNEQSLARMNEALNEPLPSEKFRVWAEEAKKASQEAAAEAVKARDAMTGGGESGADLEAEKKAEEKRQKELENARKHAEKLAEQKAEAEARELAQRQESADRNVESMEYEFASEKERLAIHLEERRAMIAEALELQRIDGETARTLEQQAAENNQKALTEIEKRESEERRRIQQQELDQRVTMMNQSIGALAALAQGGGKKQFEQRKKLGIASALVGMYQGIAEGVALGWPMAIPAVAYATTTGLAAINNIRKQQYGSTGGGSAISSGGAMGSVPQAGGNGGQAGGGSQSIFVRGIDPNQMFSGQQLVDIINNATKSGAVLRIA